MEHKRKDHAKLKIAIIGCGAAAERYYVPVLKKFPAIVDHLVLVDRNLDQAGKISDAIGGGEIFSDHTDIIGQVDGAIITLPNFLHHSVAIDFLKAKVPVLCEKPLADSYHHARELVETAKENKVNLCVNNTRRMFPVYQDIKNLLSDESLGTIRSLKYTEGAVFGWASATGFYVDPKVSSKGILSDLGPHALDTVCWWLGDCPDLIEYRDDSFGGPESVSKIVAQYQECRLEIFLNRLIDLDGFIEIEGDLGRLIAKPMDWSNYSIEFSAQQAKRKQCKSHHKNYPSFVKPIFDNFLKTISDGEAPLVSGSDVLHSLNFIDQCYNQRQQFELPWYHSIHVYDQQPSDKVLITGATGFIGGSVVENLILSNKHRPCAVVHNWASAARLGRFPCDMINVDLMQSDTVRKALENVTEIIHCAKGDYEVTVRGTENLLREALEAGVKRVVYLSTTEVYGNVEGHISEDSPLVYTGNEYNRMKVDAEKICWDYIEKGLPLTIVRPSIVYGPFSNNWTVNLANKLLNQRWAIYEKFGEGHCNLVYIEDLVDALIQCLEADNASGQALNIIGPEVISWNDYFFRFNQSLGLNDLPLKSETAAGIASKSMEPVRKLGAYVKKHFLAPVKKVAENVSIADIMLRKLEMKLKTTPSLDEMKLYNRKAHYSNEKAKQLISFNPSISVSLGLEKTSYWLRHHNLLN